MGSAPLPTLALEHQVPLLGSVGGKGFLYLGASAQDALPHSHPTSCGLHQWAPWEAGDLKAPRGAH